MEGSSVQPPFPLGVLRVVALKLVGSIEAVFVSGLVVFNQLCFIDQTALGSYNLQFFYPAAIPVTSTPIEVTDSATLIKLSPTSPPFPAPALPHLCDACTAGGQPVACAADAAG